ncbi:hypothetical protein AVEN_143267-1 [Araneus ventricosus]|uniref:BPTI/Kunitz inhibitor domain-containing protein n=1 Tax=Araneus ventricosus TaxID=182803 RepID=A0A4Y2AEA9_ARAVE|nr:hypothetical protein AVEN_143267-1 [Araneus ventricosus]
MFRPFILICAVLISIAFVNTVGAQRNSICRLRPVSGFCLGYFIRYYYKVNANECREFVYGGCWGNANNFRSKEECERKCVENSSDSSEASGDSSDYSSDSSDYSSDSSESSGDSSDSSESSGDFYVSDDSHSYL